MIRAWCLLILLFSLQVYSEPTELERYLEWAKYPPNSRPLEPTQVDLLDPYNSDRPPVPVSGLSAACTLVPQSAVSVGTKEFKIYLHCKSSLGQPLKVDSVKARVYTEDRGKQKASAAPRIDAGNRPDQSIQFLVKPGVQDWGDMFLEADFNVQGKRHNQRAHWFSTPHNVAEFKQGATESVRQGHLYVRIPVWIHKAGYFAFDANLFSKSGPVATSSVEGDYSAGLQTIEFQFFGKVIRDKKAGGPFTIRNIRGMRNNSPVTPSMVRDSINGKPLPPHKEQTEPWQEFMEPFAGAVTTAPHSLAVFSSLEWQSPEKTRRIQFLRGLEKK
jgi:hypothetical protein